LPRFYFGVREGANFTPDEQGLEFTSLDAAEHEAAVAAAAEIGRERLPKGDVREVTARFQIEAVFKRGRLKVRSPHLCGRSVYFRNVP
jgi:hypothetical protein